MIEPKKALSLIKRLEQLWRFPKDAECRQDLASELEQSRSLDEAKSVIDGFLGSATSETPCPLASDIRRALQARLEDMRPDPDCRECLGGGWTHGTKGLYSFSEKCVCWERRPAQAWEGRVLPGGSIEGNAGRRKELLPVKDISKG